LKITKTILSSFWTIQKIIEDQCLIEIKLWGNPLYSSQENDAKIKFFLCLLLKEYYFIGYHFQVLTDLQQNESSASALIFERRFNLSTNTICLSLHQSDKIQVFAPDHIIENIKQVINLNWPLHIQKEEIVDYGILFFY
jgi:hypothetical protein